MRYKTLELVDDERWFVGRKRNRAWANESGRLGGLSSLNEGGAHSDATLESMYLYK